MGAIEKETLELKDKEAALRAQEVEAELAKKERERRAYEEVTTTPCGSHSVTACFLPGCYLPCSSPHGWTT